MRGQRPLRRNAAVTFLQRASELAMASNNPVSQRKAGLPPAAFVYLGVIIMSWAGNWPLMKLALGQVPPLVFVLFRLIGSLALIAPALVATRQPLLPVRGERMSLFWVGFSDLYVRLVAMGIITDVRFI